MEVHKAESVEHGSGGVRKGVRLQDVHSPRRQRPRERGKQQGPVGSKNRQLVSVPPLPELHLHGAIGQLARHAVVGGDLLRRVGFKVPPGEAFEEGAGLGPAP